MRTTCDWCLQPIRVRDGTVHTTDNVIICTDECAEAEIDFRHTFTDERIAEHCPTGRWIKERIKWTSV